MRACLIKWHSLASTGKPNIVAVPTQAIYGGINVKVCHELGTAADEQYYDSSPTIIKKGT